MSNYKDLYLENENEKYKEEFNMFYENGRKFIEFLKSNNYLTSTKINKLKKRFRKAILSVSKLDCIMLKYDDEEKYLPLDEIQGVTVSAILKGKLQPQMCIINLNDVTKEEARQVMFHEMMHLVSKKIIKQKHNYNAVCGVSFTKNNAQYNNIINEALTEIVAKKIYDKIYNANYNLFEVEDEVYLDSTIIMYNLVNGLIDKDLFDIYFNNKVDKFEKIVFDKIGIELFDLECMLEEEKYDQIAYLIKDAIPKEKIIKKYY